MQLRFMGTVMKTCLLGDWIWFDVVFPQFLGFLALFIIFLLGIFPRPVLRRSQPRQEPPPQRDPFLYPEQPLYQLLVLQKPICFPQIWRKVLAWEFMVDRDSALVDDGNLERFLLRMIRISYHENHPRILEWYKNQYFILISWISPWFACHFGRGQMIKIMIFWKW